MTNKIASFVELSPSEINSISGGNVPDLVGNHRALISATFLTCCISLLINKCATTINEFRNDLANGAIYGTASYFIYGNKENAAIVGMLKFCASVGYDIYKEWENQGKK